MNKEKDMSKEAFNETIDNFEVFGKLTLWGRKNIKYHVKKLQEENDSLKKILDTMGLDANKILYLEKENKELKETLKGTTHCFDEEEHQRLIKENEELKNKQNKFEKDYKEIIKIQGQNGNYNFDRYMLGFYNGMEMIIALYENREPNYKDADEIKFLSDKQDILQQRIDKAIEYTKKHFKEMVADEEAQELLSILQDEEVK